MLPSKNETTAAQAAAVRREEHFMDILLGLSSKHQCKDSPRGHLNGGLITYRPHVRRAYSRIFCRNRKLSIVLMAAAPARNTMRLELSSVETLPAWNKT